MARSTIRGPVGHTNTTLVPPIGRLLGHVPTATNGHTGSLRVLVVAWRLVWRYHRELLVVAVPLAVLDALAQALTPVAAWALWLAMAAAAVAVDRRHQVVVGWLSRGRMRRRWDRACRQLWLSNLNDRTPRIRRLSSESRSSAAAHRLVSASPISAS